MKRLLIIILLALLASVACFAQTATERCDSQAVADVEFRKAAKRHAAEYEKLINSKTLKALDVFYPLRELYHFDDFTVELLQGRLIGSYGDEAAVLFFNSDGTRFQSWLIGAKGIAAYDCQDVPHAKIVEAINDFRTALEIDRIQSVSNRVPRLREIGIPFASSAPRFGINEASRNLTDILIRASARAGLRSVRKLIIVPVLELGTIPFAALKPFGNDEYLIDKMSISLAPSLFDIGLSINKTSWNADFKHPLIVANPTYTDKSKWILQPLPGAENEAREIAKILGAPSILSGNTASKDAVLAKVNDADLLYFATHGIADVSDSRRQSYLVLGPSGTDKGFWTMEEILDRRYAASLVVLSACQTGLGESYQGGVMALGRTFQVAGVPRSVMSLWNVDDAATKELMVSFVNNLKQKHLPTEALRLAMIETRKNRPNPNQWASFVYFGMPN